MSGEEQEARCILPLGVYLWVLKVRPPEHDPLSGPEHSSTPSRPGAPGSSRISRTQAMAAEIPATSPSARDAIALSADGRHPGGVLGKVREPMQSGRCCTREERTVQRRVGASKNDRGRNPTATESGITLEVYYGVKRSVDACYRVHTALMPMSPALRHTSVHRSSTNLSKSTRLSRLSDPSS